jgi:hypothetical protein
MNKVSSPYDQPKEMDEGGFALVDCLGFKGIWKRTDPIRLLEILHDLEDSANGEALALGALMQDTVMVHARMLSDTLAISLRQPRSTPVEKGNQLVAHVVLAMISLIHRFAMNDPPLLLRGCITYGPHLCDRSFLVGPAVDCAAEHMNLPQGAFVWLHPSAANRYRAHIQRIKAEHPDFDPQYVIKDYPMPLKGGEVLQADVVNPLEATPDDPQNLIDAFEEGMNGDSVDIWIKRQHTLAFPRAVLAARGGGSRT